MRSEMRSRQSRRPRHHRYIFRRWWVLLLTVFVFIGGAIVEGIFGNLGSDIFRSLWKWLVTSIGMNWLPWVIVLLFLGLVVYFWFNNRFLDRALITTSNLLETDDSLLRLLGSWVPAKSHETEMKLLLAELLRDTCREFGEHVQRAFVLLPDPQEEVYLRIWAYTKMSQESIDRMKFYIGTDESKRVNQGVAGEAFLTKEFRVAHMSQKDREWKCDLSSYINFTTRNHAPLYRSFACIPVLGPAPNIAGGIISLGVVCFDSPNRTVFDSYESEIVLRTFARRISTALLIYRLLSIKPEG